MAEGVIQITTTFPPVKTVLSESLGAILPSHALGFIIFFSIYMALGGLFRGPAQPWSMGSAVSSFHRRDRKVPPDGCGRADRRI